jgi:EAL domain-containing protein (putative c-di-GMP-specific phosphodiesterase class I)/GGDEF domain-containing protein
MTLIRLVEAADGGSVADDLFKIMQQRRLHSVFQPIVDLRSGRVLGHEGLIRGPQVSALHLPLALFQLAKEQNRLYQLELLSLQITLETFAKLANNNKIFVNVSPECLLRLYENKALSLSYINDLGLNPENIVLELTEGSPIFDYSNLYRIIGSYRSIGFKVALDDLGEGFSSLRLWSELQPEYVKIDKHFIKSINADPVKLQFVKSIQQIAENSGAQVIAEGVETEAELAIVKDLNIAYCQGYLLGRPQALPVSEIPQNYQAIFQSNVISVFPSASLTHTKGNVSRLLVKVPVVAPESTNDEVYALFQNNPSLYSIPVVAGDVPFGLISRYSMIDRFFVAYGRELYGKRSCTEFMDKTPLIVESTISFHELSALITQMEPHHLSHGFIITDRGKYLGLGSGHALLREITEMQISAARYANPLTLLPGNVPINEHIDRLLERNSTFWACYCDLDNFKPFNDAYGFRRGDELIQLLGKMLTETASSDIDFVGHVGGDDFILIFQSEDWEERCQKLLSEIGLAMPQFYAAEDREIGGIYSEDRRGNQIFYPLSSLSIGVVKIVAKQFASHHEVSAGMTDAKKQAKRMPGNSLFYERRALNSNVAG